MVNIEIVSNECDPTILASLADHPSLSVRCRVASNPHTPVSELKTLIYEKDTRFFVALNPSLTSTLAYLLYAEAIRVTHLTKTPILDSDSLENLFRNKNCPESVYDLAAHSFIIKVRACLAACSKAPLKILTKMAVQEENKYIQGILSQNPSLPTTYKLLLIMES